MIVVMERNGVVFIYEDGKEGEKVVKGLQLFLTQL